MCDDDGRCGGLIVLRSYYINGVLKSEWTLKSGETRYYSPTGKHDITVEQRN